MSNLANVGFQISPQDQLYGYGNGVSNERRLAINQSLQAGTLRLQKLFFEEVIHLHQLLAGSVQGSRTVSNLQREIRILLAYLCLRNSQCQEAPYRKITAHAQFYWDSNLQGFEWPEVLPRVVGAWGPLGTLAFWYFFYGVTHSPVDLVDYCAQAVQLYWRYLSEKTELNNLNLNTSPRRRWRTLLNWIEWHDPPAKQVEELLNNWYASPRRAWFEALRLGPGDWRNLHRRLLFGEVSPELAVFIEQHRERIAEELDTAFHWSFSAQRRLKLGPGGLEQALLAFMCESLVQIEVEVSHAHPATTYLELLGDPNWEELRIPLRGYFQLLYQALVTLDWQDLNPLRDWCRKWLVNLWFGRNYPELEEISLWGRLQVDQLIEPGDELIFLDWTKQFPKVKGTTVPGAGDTLEILEKPLTVDNRSPHFVKVSGKKGWQVEVRAREQGPFILKSVPVVIGDDNTALVPFSLENVQGTRIRVELQVTVEGAPNLAKPFSVILPVLSETSEQERIAQLKQILRQRPEGLESILDQMIDRLIEQQQQENQQVVESMARDRQGANNGFDPSGILGGIFKVFSEWGRTNPVSTHKRQKEQQEQKIHFASAEQSENQQQITSEFLKENKEKVQPKVKSVAPAETRQVIEEYNQTAVQAAGQNVAASAVSRAQNEAAGRTLLQSNDIWHVSSQQARIQSTANFEVYSAQTLVTSQLATFQCNHRIGIHDHIQDTTQYAWYRSTKLRQCITEHNIDYHNMWHKATSANAHYVAGHHFQYGDELLVAVGQSKQNDDTQEAELSEEGMLGNEEDLETNAIIQTETLQNQNYNSLDGLIEALETGEAQVVFTNTNLAEMASLNGQIADVAKRFPSLANLGTQLASILTGNSGLGGFFSLFSGLIGNISSDLQTALILLGQIQQLVHQFQQQQQQGGGGGGSSGGGSSGSGSGNMTLGDLQNLTEALATQVVAALQEASQKTSTAKNRYLVAKAAVEQFVQLYNSSSGSSGGSSGTGGSGSGGSGGDSGGGGSGIEKFAPFVQVIVGSALKILGGNMGNVEGVVSTFLGALGGNFSQIGQGAMAIANSLGSFIGGSTGQLLSNAAQQFSQIGSNLGEISSLSGMANLTSIGAGIEALGLGNMQKLHRENSKVNKYGSHVLRVYKEMAIKIQREGLSVDARRDISINSKAGKLTAKARQVGIEGSISAEIRSKARTVIRSNSTVIISAPKIYLSGTVYGPKPIPGSAPSFASNIASQLEKLKEQIDTYMNYMKTVMSLIGADGDGAPAMETPPPPPTDVAPATAEKIPKLADQTHYGGGLPPTTNPPDPVPYNSNLYSQKLPQHFLNQKPQNQSENMA